jgi:8-oxo-dGTP pyrophosphatase MutT (NUDIX family)
MDIQLIERLERELEEELPGYQAHIKMAPKERQEYTDIPDTHIKACVLALLFPKNKAWHITLIHRVSDNPNDPHAGQLGFPGGKFEDTDYSYQDCALREAEEELGITASEIGIIGELSSLYIPLSNYLIYPFVGFLSSEPDFNPQKSEVSSVITLPLNDLIDNRNKKQTKIETTTKTLEDVPYYDVHDIPLWGATAMIISELEHVLAKANE